jgi:hypothetical protein
VLFLDSWIRIWDGKKIRIRDPRSGINISDHISESLVTMFEVTKLNFFVNSVMQIREGQIQIQNPGWTKSGKENSDPEPEINIPDPQHWSQHSVKGRYWYRTGIVTTTTT